MLAHRFHPAAELASVGVHRVDDGVLHAVDVVRVHQECLPELIGCSGELAQHQGTRVVVPAGHVLLGDQVHAVAQRRDHSDVSGPEERGHLRTRVGSVQVVDGGGADPAMFAIDPADQQFDLVAQYAVLLDPLP